MAISLDEQRAQDIERGVTLTSQAQQIATAYAVLYTQLQQHLKVVNGENNPTMPTASRWVDEAIDQLKSQPAEEPHNQTQLYLLGLKGLHAGLTAMVRQVDKMDHITLPERLIYTKVLTSVNQAPGVDISAVNTINLKQLGESLDQLTPALKDKECAAVGEVLLKSFFAQQKRVAAQKAAEVKPVDTSASIKAIDASTQRTLELLKRAKAHTASKPVTSEPAAAQSPAAPPKDPTNSEDYIISGAHLAVTELSKKPDESKRLLEARCDALVSKMDNAVCGKVSLVTFKADDSSHSGPGQK